MRLALFYRKRLSGLAGRTIFLIAAATLAGCAAKNPLMEEPVAATRPAATEVKAAPTAATTVSSNASPANAPASGVQIVQQRRFLGFLSPYRPDIQQGNFVSQEMVDQLKEGMTREQVSFVLGTPLLTDIFHADRWDYAFRLIKGNGEITTSRVTVFFKENRLARFEGGNLPTEKDYLARIAGSAPPPAAKSASPAVPSPQTPPSSVTPAQ